MLPSLNAMLKTIKCSAEEVQDGSNGACLACGEIQCGVEPDARGHICESCGQPKVYGLEELLFMGLIDLDTDGE